MCINKEEEMHILLEVHLFYNIKRKLYAFEDYEIMIYIHKSTIKQLLIYFTIVYNTIAYNINTDNQIIILEKYIYKILMSS